MGENSMGGLKGFFFLSVVLCLLFNFVWIKFFFIKLGILIFNEKRIFHKNYILCDLVDGGRVGLGGAAGVCG
jgi:hypothetical protein